MFTIINTTGGVWGVCETREEAEQVCLRKGYTIQEDIKDAEIDEKPKKRKKSNKVIE